jgi:acetoin utilization deacetylase AcuC-like enzyme
MEDLVIFYPEGHAAHAQPGHPEWPERVEAIRASLQSTGIWEQAVCLEPVDLPLDFIAQIHAPEYLETLHEFCRRGANLDGDTYTTPASWQLALKSAGGAAAVAQAVWTGNSRRGFALCRPPGHHAVRQRGMGFCLLNNIALAAQYLLAGPLAGGEHARQLAIVDLDLHHGNGTQGAFWSRKEVAFLSSHQSPHYPGSGRLDEQGAGEGLGYTVNFPLPSGSGDQAFQSMMEQLFLPLLDRFAPQMVLVSFGFDPHWRDPMGGLQLSADGMYHLIQALTGWADRNCAGKIALFLEGGYDLEAARACSQAAAAGLLDRPWQDPLGPSPQHESSDWVNILDTARRLYKV